MNFIHLTDQNLLFKSEALFTPNGILNPQRKVLGFFVFFSDFSKFFLVYPDFINKTGFEH